MARFIGPAPLILLVEDDFDIRAAVQALLEWEGYSVVCAANGSDGLRKSRGVAAPSLVLLDLRMPVMDGEEFLAEWKRDPRLAPIPVIAFSAAADERSTVGAAAYLRKSGDLEDLLALIRRHLPSPSRVA